MKERPIPFSGPMVRAILDGRKTQTRRVVKGKFRDIELSVLSDGRRLDSHWTATKANGDRVGLTSQYGVAGHRLWVRETWRVRASVPISHINAGLNHRHLHFAADCDSYTVSEKGPWKPSIHMPRWASRLTLEITGVRVERLRDISEEDARAEGVEPGRGYAYDNKGTAYMRRGEADFTGGFELLWDSLNTKHGHGWDANPWVWVIEFQVVA